MSPRVARRWDSGSGKDKWSRDNSEQKASELFLPEEEGGLGYTYTELEPGLFLVQSPRQVKHADWGYEVHWPEQTCNCPVQAKQGWAGCKHSLGLYFEFADKGGRYGAEEAGDDTPQ